MSIKTEKLIKSRERVKNNGEVFTPMATVNDMCDMTEGVKEAIESNQKNVMDPACGNGNFLIEMLDRRINKINKTMTPETNYDLEVIKAVSGIYGIDIAYDNIQEARELMMEVINSHYLNNFGHPVEDKRVLEAINFVLVSNIILGDTLKCKMKDRWEPGNRDVVLTDNDIDLVLTEFTFDGDMVTMKEFYLKNIKFEVERYEPIHYLNMHKRKSVRQRNDMFIMDDDGMV